MLNSEPARQFFSAFVCWDAKRPVTVELLKKIDLGKLASHIGEADAFAALFDRHDPQQRLFAT
jgi:hypothetical protein